MPVPVSTAMQVRDACAAQPGGCPLCGEYGVQSGSLACAEFDSTCETHRVALELVQRRPFGDVFGRAGMDLEAGLMRETGCTSTVAQLAVTAAWNAIRRRAQGFA